ncbi:hypothetical protein RAS1_08630 [Phycisphaerae bacterium RAS1]|nr:hypothetical protein RAS1_08630 [Phycisphaerae bacterium RAS1]
MSAPWPIVSLGTVLRHRKEFVRIDDAGSYKRCRVQLHAKGIVIRDVVDGVALKTKEQQVCRSGEFLVAEIDAKMGGYGIVPAELDGAIVSSHYFLFEIDSAKLNRGFLGYFIRTPAFFEQVAAQGTTNYAAIRPAHVLAYRVPLPPLEEQRRIVDQIDQVAVQLAEVQRIRQQADQESEMLITSSHFHAARNRIVPLGEVLELHEESVPIVPDGEYPQIGLRGFGAGMFAKQAVRGSETTYKRFNRLYQDAVVLSQVKGWEGAIAVCTTEFVGVYASPEYRTFRCIPGFGVPKYLAAMFRTPWFMKNLATLTRGVGARRERTRPEHFLALQVPMPTAEAQEALVHLFQRIERLRQLRARAARDSEALLPSLLQRVFRPAHTTTDAAPAPARKHSATIYFRRAAIAAYIIDRLHARPTFGRVQLEKCLYLAEAYVGVDLEGEFKRAAAGPLDAEYLYKLESAAQKNGWFVKRTIAGDKTRHTYHPGAKSAQLLAAAEKYLGAGKAKMDFLLAWMEKFDTERAEIVATLFAAWSDLLRAGHPATDDTIITEVRENWHESKKRFEPTRLRIALGWMREHHLAPTQTDATIA